MSDAKKQRSTSFVVVQALIDEGKEHEVSWTVQSKQKDDAGNEVKNDEGKVVKVEKEVSKVPTIGKPVCVVADQFVTRLIERFGQALMSFDCAFPKSVRQQAFFRMRVSSVMDALKAKYPNSTPANRRRFVINVGHVMSTIILTAIEDCSRTRNRAVSADLVESLCRLYERVGVFPLAAEKPDAKTTEAMFVVVGPQAAHSPRSPQVRCGGPSQATPDQEEDD